MELFEKLRKVIESLIKIKNQLTESGNVFINLITVKIGNKSVYITLPEKFDAEKIIGNSEWNRIVEQKTLEALRPFEDRINALEELKQLHIMTNAATKIIDVAFLKNDESDKTE